MELQPYFDRLIHEHARLCPRQILGVRMGLAGLAALGFEGSPRDRQLLVTAETDGCFVDGISAATGCTIGHRTLRLEDYGKTAAVFVNTSSGESLRITPSPDLRQKANVFAPGEPNTYSAQMLAYQSLPANEMFAITPVIMVTPLAQILSLPGLRVICVNCGEEIMNGREVTCNGTNVCRACAGIVYYTARQPD